MSVQVCYIETTVCSFTCVDNNDNDNKNDVFMLTGINLIQHVSWNQESKVSDSLTLRGFSVSDNKSFTSAWT